MINTNKLPKFSDMQDDFLAYVYDNYLVGNGDQLLRLSESNKVIQEFLDTQDLAFDEVDFD